MSSSQFSKQIIETINQGSADPDRRVQLFAAFAGVHNQLNARENLQTIVNAQSDGDLLVSELATSLVEKLISTINRN